ncbi:preprotein translocase subunit SecG [uncultured Dubosiella sp.]|uniref:preprotein translocase subunit SecG n=1 Tax=uncultured Dubosiella sp. TaxID=1937011 RepID=UPI00273226BC|nr:preprotein translocase subunit SecG [uncultured Dubosiella sp.]
MEQTLDILLMVLSGIIIILTLLQGGKSDGLSSAFTGSGDSHLLSHCKLCNSKGRQAFFL